MIKLVKCDEEIKLGDFIVIREFDWGYGAFLYDPAIDKVANGTVVELDEEHVYISKWHDEIEIRFGES